MHKINITERTGNYPNENLPAWYKEKVKVMAEIIMKRKFSESFEIASPPSAAHNDISAGLEVVVK